MLQRDCLSHHAYHALHTHDRITPAHYIVLQCRNFLGMSPDQLGFVVLLQTQSESLKTDHLIVLPLVAENFLYTVIPRLTSDPANEFFS